MVTQERKIKRAWMAIVAFVFLAAIEVMDFIYYSSHQSVLKRNVAEAIYCAVMFLAVAVILIVKRKKLFPVALCLLVAKYAIEAYLSIEYILTNKIVQNIVSGTVGLLFGTSILVILTVFGLYSASESLGYERGMEKRELFCKIYKISFCVLIVSSVLMVVSSFMLKRIDFIITKVGFFGSIDDAISVYRRRYIANLFLIPAIASLKLLLIPSPKKIGASDKIYVANEYYVSLGKHICLLIFTFGIWQMIWIYKQTKFTNNASGEEERNPTTKLLLYLFIPFYSIYWTYKTAQRIDNIGRERGVHSDLGTVCLILAIFVPIVPPILMQDKVNQIITGKVTVPKQNENDTIESIEKYKGLLDAGIITQEEFDAKKKQLLGL